MYQELHGSPDFPLVKGRGGGNSLWRDILFQELQALDKNSWPNYNPTEINTDKEMQFNVLIK